MQSASEDGANSDILQTASVVETDADNLHTASYGVAKTSADVHPDNTDDKKTEIPGSSVDLRKDLTEAAVWVNPHNVTMDRTSKGIRFTATGDDPYIYVFLDRSEETADTSRYLYFKVRTGKKTVQRSVALYFLAEEDSEPTEQWVETIFYNRYYPEALTLLPDNIAGFRFDIDDDVDSVTFEALTLVECGHPLTHYEKLRNTQIQDISFSHDLYQADVSVADEGGSSLLCVPFLYSRGWTATVNGEAAEVLNVNGGLVGIRLQSGSSHVELRYAIPGFTLGVLISLAALALYIAAIAYALLRKREPFRRA